MIRATHITTTAAIAALAHTTEPLGVLLIGIISHYILDAIPHWEYDLASLHNRRGNAKERRLTLDRRATVLDMFRVTLDIFMGVALLLMTPAFSFDTLLSPLFVALTVGAILPDVLQPLGLIIKKSPFTNIHDFGERIHSKISIKAFPWGVALQVGLILGSMLVLSI